MPVLPRHRRLLRVPRMALLLCHRRLRRRGRARILYLPTNAGLLTTGTRSSWCRGRLYIGARCLAPHATEAARAGLLYRCPAFRIIIGAGSVTMSTDAAKAVLLFVSMSSRTLEVGKASILQLYIRVTMHLLRCRLCFFALPRPRIPLYDSIGWGPSRTVIASMLDPMLFDHIACVLYMHIQRQWRGRSSTRLPLLCFREKACRVRCRLCSPWLSAVATFYLCWQVMESLSTASTVRELAAALSLQIPDFAATLPAFTLIAFGLGTLNLEGLDTFIQERGWVLDSEELPTVRLLGYMHTSFALYNRHHREQLRVLCNRRGRKPSHPSSVRKLLCN